jgi:hypothetical protein
LFGQSSSDPQGGAVHVPFRQISSSRQSRPLVHGPSGWQTGWPEPFWQNWPCGQSVSAEHSSRHSPGDDGEVCQQDWPNGQFGASVRHPELQRPELSQM